MSDEPDDISWFPRAVRDSISAIVALCGFISCGAAGLLAIWTFAVVKGGSLGNPAEVMFGILFGTTAACVVTVYALLVGTRYRHHGVNPVAATAVCVGFALVGLAGTAALVGWALLSFGLLAGFCASFAESRVIRLAHRAEVDLPPSLHHPARVLLRYQLWFCVLLGGEGLLACSLIGSTWGRGILSTDAAELILALYAFLLSAFLCVWCWLRFFRPCFELCVEPLFAVPYRVRKTGVGLKQFPPFGPCLVVANHACWFDPIFVAKALPRPVTPIMTARFFNVWFLKPILKYVFRVIVVPETPLKRETPELEQAIAALDRGEVVVIFPEGYLRRKEEVPLRRFAQGVWRILHARPDTPVVACWVEGGWGSHFSYKNGPPTKNKPMDFRRPIGVAVSTPAPVPAEVLADQMATRVHLMNRVAGMRSELGLPPLPPFDVPNTAEHQEEPA